MNLSQLYSIFLQYPRLVTDSRKVTRGDFFIALQGASLDGNKYAAAALEKGAAYVMIDDPACYREDDRYVLVDNVLLTLQDLALHHRRQFEIPVIAIGGSNGKTTTKELVSAVMGSHYPIHYTAGNFNNHIGLPLTLLGIKPETEVAILEIGANHPGEIAQLCRIAEPTHGLLTNIGKEHLEGFGSLDGVKKSESELYRYLAAHNGMVFINLNEPFLEDLARGVSKKLFYTLSDAPNIDNHPYEMKFLGAEPFLEIAFLSDAGDLTTVKTQIIGEYNLPNIMTAIALGRYFKVPGIKIKQALEGYLPSNNRSQLIRQDGNTYVMDAYNANPSSVEKALESFVKMSGAPKIVFLGDMLELGADSAMEHDHIAKLAQGYSFDQLVLVGEEFERTTLTPEILHFPNIQSARNWWEQQGITGALILVKGSRGIRMEGLLG